MKILAPHKEQDGWVYVRVRRLDGVLLFHGHESCHPAATAIEYDDANTESRIISSRRVESDVETGDYLRRCADEGLHVEYYTSIKGDRKWRLGGEAGDNLREAYFRYHAVEGARLAAEYEAVDK